MNYDVTTLSRAQLMQIIKLTTLSLEGKISYLSDNFNYYSINYSDEAKALLNGYYSFSSAVKLAFDTEEYDKLDDAGLMLMAQLSLKVSEAYRLGVRTPDDQMEYEETIKQFKADVYKEAIRRLNENRKELATYISNLTNEVGNKNGNNLKPVYQYHAYAAQYYELAMKHVDAMAMGNEDLCAEIHQQQIETNRNMEILKKDCPLISQLTKPNKFPKQIKDLEKKISKAQNNVEKQLKKGTYPIWELNPIISDLFANVEYYQDESRQQYIREWISEQERIDQIFDVFTNAIPIALSIACFFMPGGVSVALLILQGMNAAIGAAAAIDDIGDAGRTKDMAYSQFASSREANRMVEEADLSGVERDYAMAIVSGIFSIGDFSECLKIARQLGMTDDFLKFVSRGKVTEAEIKGIIQEVKKSFAVKLGLERKNAEQILKEAGYVNNKLIQSQEWNVRRLQKYYNDDELIDVIKECKKKHRKLESFLDEVYVDNEIIPKIKFSKSNITRKRKEQIYYLKRYYTDDELIKLINGSSEKSLENVLNKQLCSIKKELAVPVSSNQNTNFAEELMENLKENSMTKEQFEILRNLDYDKMTPEEYEKIKDQIKVITDLTESYDLVKNPPKGFMTKFIPVEDIDKYIERKYTGIGGFIAREEDVNHLKTFEDVFNTMRLDYEGNNFIYSKEIGFIKFKSKSYNNTMVPIAKSYGGNSKFPQPYGGMGLTKSMNGQVVREYIPKKIIDGNKEINQYLDYYEAYIYKIDKTGNTSLVASFDGKKWRKNK